MYDGGFITHDASGPRPKGSARVPELEEGKQYKFLGVLESVMQEDRLSLECAAKESLSRMSVIRTSPLSDHNRDSINSGRATSVELLNVDTPLVFDGTEKNRQGDSQNRAARILTFSGYETR